MRHFQYFVFLTGILICSSSFAETRVLSSDERRGVIDTETNEWIIPNRYQSITEIKGDRYKPADFYSCQSNGLFAIFTSSGQRITEFAFDYVKDTHYDEVFIVKQNGKWGLMDRNGFIVKPFEYSVITTGSNGLYASRGSQRETIPYSEIPSLRQQARKSGNRYQYDMEENNWALKESRLLPPQKKDLRKGLADTGNAKSFHLNNIQSARMNPCINGYFTVKESNGDMHIFSKDGDHMFTFKSPNERDVVFSEKGTALARLDNSGTLCLIRPDGSIIKRYDKVNMFSDIDGEFAVLTTENLECFTIDSEGNELSRYKLKKVVNGSHLDYVFVDAAGKEIQNDLFKAINWMGDRLTIKPLIDNFRLRTSGGVAFLDWKCDRAFAGSFILAHNFSDGLAAVAVRDGNDYKWGYIDRSGKYVIEPMFSKEPGDFSEGYALVTKKDGSLCYIDKSGKICCEGLKRAKKFYNGYAVVNRNSEYDILLDKSFNLVKYSPYSIFTGSRMDGFIIDGSNVWTPAGEGVVSLSGSLTTSSGSEVYPCNSKGKYGYANIRGEWIIVFTENEF